MTTPYQVPPVPRTAVQLFDQGYWWRVRDGRYVPIAEMTPEYRLSTTRFLERHARAYQMRYDLELLHSPMFGDAPEDMDLWLYEPEEWLKGTRLYRCLAAGLPTGGKPLRKLAARAKHWSTCPMRLRKADRAPGAQCSCAQAAEADRAARESVKLATMGVDE